MAYGLKYELIFDNIYAYPGQTSKPVYRVRIYKDGYTALPSPIKLIGDASPVVIETMDSEGKSYNPIISKRASINLIKDENLNVEEFFNADDNDFKLTIESGTKTGVTYTWTNTIFVGLYVPVETLVFSPILASQITLVFNDGLANLKEHKIYYDNMFIIAYTAGETYSFKDILTNAFGVNSLNINFNVNWYYKNTGISDRELENMFVEKNSFINNPSDYLIWYDVLDGICRKFGFVCYQKNGEYYLTSYGSLTRSNSRSYYKYDYTGTYLSTFTETDTNVEIDATDDFKQTNSSLLVTLSKGNKSYVEKSMVQNGIQAVLNGDFSSWSSNTIVDGWTGGLSYQRNGTNNELRAYTSQTIGLGNGSSIESQPVECKNGDVISVFSDLGTSGLFQESARLILEPTDGTLPTYYWTPLGYFQDTDYILTHADFTSSTVKYAYIPCDGVLKVRFYQPYYVGPTIPNLYTKIGYFRIQYFGINSSVQNFNAIVWESARDSLFNRDSQSYSSLTFFSNASLLNTIESTITFTNGDNVAASRFMGSWLTSGRSAILDSWQRNGTGDTNELFYFTSEDIGVDELYNQLKIEGDFISAGYDISSKFNYSYGTGVATTNYLLISYKWDLKLGIQSSVLYGINYGLTSNFVRNLYLNSK